MTVILRDFTHSSVSDDELRLLVSYIEQDIHDYKRQSTAFPLLRVSKPFSHPCHCTLLETKIPYSRKYIHFC